MNIAVVSLYLSFPVTLEYFRRTVKISSILNFDSSAANPSKLVSKLADLNTVTKSIESDSCSIVEEGLMFDNAHSGEFSYMSYIVITKLYE